MWNNKQKALVHIYVAAAKLENQDYRDLLYKATGCATAVHAGLTNFHFDKTMAALEAVLAYRVEEGLVPMPDTGRIRDLSYWRRKLPAPGGINSRQHHEIQDWWYKLQPYLAKEERTPQYLRATASKASGYRNLKSLCDLRANQACMVIEALKDRLRWALKKDGGEAHFEQLRHPDTRAEVEATYADPEAVEPQQHEPDTVPFVHVEEV